MPVAVSSRSIPQIASDPRDVLPVDLLQSNRVSRLLGHESRVAPCRRSSTAVLAAARLCPDATLSCERHGKRRHEALAPYRGWSPAPAIIASSPPSARSIANGHGGSQNPSFSPLVSVFSLEQRCEARARLRRWSCGGHR
jgi:hypothetical protein